MLSHALEAVIFVACLLPSAGAFQQSGITAVVTDTKGVAYNVADLKARYDTRETPNYQPMRLQDTDDIRILMFITENRVTTTEDLILPFRSLQRASFKFVDGHTGWLLRFERRDGSAVVMHHWATIDLIDASGRKEVRKVSDSEFIRSYALPTVPLKLTRFVGRAATPGGKQGIFEIEWREVATIEFK